MTNNGKKIFHGIIIIVMLCSMLFSYKFFIKTEAIEIPWMPVTDIQKSIDTFATLGYCTDGCATEDGLGAIIQLTEWQKKKWLKTLHSDLKMYIEWANQVYFIHFSIAADTKELILYLDKTASFETVATYLGVIFWEIENIQILSGDNDWGFKFVVKDMETEEILYEADFPQDSIKMDASIWDKKDE